MIRKTPALFVFTCALISSGIATSAAVAAVGDEQSFGTKQRTSGTLIGIFYDLKQTQRQEPIPDYAQNYSRALDDFLVSGLDEALLNRFFRAPLPLYTTQFAIPRMSAQAAPKAFGVDDVVKPSYWLIHYKGQVIPPTDGTYRFVGNFDDVLIVAINRRIVLNGCRPKTKLPRLNWHEPKDKGPEVAANELARYGDWVDLKADQPVDLDIIIGERPGGVFQGVVLYQKKGVTYPNDTKGHAVLPLFQLAEHHMSNPRFRSDLPVWKCIE